MASPENASQRAFQCKLVKVLTNDYFSLPLESRIWGNCQNHMLKMNGMLPGDFSCYDFGMF